MKPLLVLIIVFTLSCIIQKFAIKQIDYKLAVRWGMSVMLVFTAMAHFTFTKGMEMMLPDFIPNKTAVVYLTGIIEIAAAIGLFVPKVKVVTGWLLILFFILILPANIYAAIKNIDYQKGTYNGNGLQYLWFRVPLQILFIACTYFAAIKA